MYRAQQQLSCVNLQRQLRGSGFRDSNSQQRARIEPLGLRLVEERALSSDSCSKTATFKECMEHVL